MPQKVTDIDVQAAAYLASQGYRQEAISSVLKLSQSVISRLLRRAKEAGWLEECKPRFVAEKLSGEQLATIQQRVSPQPLQEQLSKLAEKTGTKGGPTVSVFPNAGLGTTAESWEFRLEWFGRAAAGHVRALLLRTKVSGVAWGGTVAHAVRGLAHLALPAPWKGQPLHFVPLCGEPLGPTVTQFSASSLAAQLDEIVNGSRHHSLSLAAIPALIPEEFGPGEVRTIRRLMSYVSAYSAIFQPETPEEPWQEPWVNKLDTR